MKMFVKKLNSRSGFTLAETLICVLILLLISAVVASAIPVAGRAYKKITDSSNAEVLLSTTMTLLRDELDMATHVRTEKADEEDPADNIIIFRSGKTGANTRISASGKSPFENGIYIEYVNYNGDTALAGRPLVSPRTATNGLYTRYTSVSISGGTVTFTGLCVMKDGKVLAGDESAAFSIRLVDTV